MLCVNYDSIKLGKIITWLLDLNKIKVTLYKDNEPLLVKTGVAKEIMNALKIRVDMPLGGYLYIQQTEALTVVDVNIGKFVSSASQAETILKIMKRTLDK